MPHSLPDYAFEGLGDVGDDLLFDRAAIGAVVFDRPRDYGWQGERGEMSGVASFLKKVGGGVANVGKAVGKGVVNAAASKVGIGPIFSGPTAQIVTSNQGAPGQGPPAPAVNYTPYIIGGGAAVLLAVVLLSRRK